MSETLFSNKNDGLIWANYGEKYVFPPLSMLPDQEPLNRDELVAACHQECELLRQALETLKIKIDSQITYTYSPSVTSYEVHPFLPKHRNALLKSTSDLALMLNAAPIRVFVSTTEINTTVIEVPHQKRHTVHLREVLESDDFVNATGRINLAVGVDTSGSNVVWDLAKTPHILMAGTTCSGKSVLINDFLLSMLYTKTPNDVKLILIDPKRVEFSSYKNIPHLLTPVISSPKKACRALNAAVEMVEKRFELFEETGVRNIDDYNQKVSGDVAGDKLPRIVIVIDELADLMFTSRKQAEIPIARISQKGRAAGIHLIISTQRIARDVISTLLTANLPTRIAFATTSSKDSGIIFDQYGAEKLLSRGDTLLRLMGALNSVRTQCCFVDDSVVSKICDFVRETNPPVIYDEALTAYIDETT